MNAKLDRRDAIRAKRQDLLAQLQELESQDTGEELDEEHADDLEESAETPAVVVNSDGTSPIVGSDGLPVLGTSDGVQAAPVETPVVEAPVVVADPTPVVTPDATEPTLPVADSTTGQGESIPTAADGTPNTSAVSEPVADTGAPVTPDALLPEAVAAPAQAPVQTEGAIDSSVPETVSGELPGTQAEADVISTSEPAPEDATIAGAVDVAPAGDPADGGVSAEAPQAGDASAALETTEGVSATNDDAALVQETKDAEAHAAVDLANQPTGQAEDAPVVVPTTQELVDALATPDTTTAEPATTAETPATDASTEPDATPVG